MCSFPPSRYSRPAFSPRERGSGLPSPFGCRSASLNLERAAFHLLVPNVLSHVPDPPFFALRSGGWIKDLLEQAYSRSRPPFSRRDRGSKYRVFSAVGPLLPTLGAQLSTFTIFQTPVLAPRPRVWITVTSPPFFALRSGVWIKDLPEQAYSRSRPPFSRRDRGSKFRGFSAVGPLLPMLGAQLSTFSIFQTPVLAPRPGVSPFGCRCTSLNLECAAFHLLVPNVLSHVPDPPFSR